MDATTIPAPGPRAEVTSLVPLRMPTMYRGDDRVTVRPPAFPRTTAQAERYEAESEARWSHERAPELEAIAALRVRAAFVADCLAGCAPNRRDQAAQAPLLWLLQMVGVRP